MDQTISLIMDVVVLAALGVTIFFALRLSNSLNNFKKYKVEFETLLKQLGKNVDQAYAAIDNLKQSTQLTGQELEGKQDQARALIDELALINQSADNLAHRLEGLAEKGRQAYVSDASPKDQTPTPVPEKKENWKDTLKKKGKKETASSGGGGFMIRDPDFENKAFDNDDDDALGSQAEKELYAALYGNGKK